MYFLDRDENISLKNLGLCLTMNELLQLQGGINALIIGQNHSRVSIYDPKTARELVVEIEGNNHGSSAMVVHANITSIK